MRCVGEGLGEVGSVQTLPDLGDAPEELMPDLPVDTYAGRQVS